MIMVKRNVIHYDIGSAIAACSYQVRGVMTCAPRKVTCSACMNTKAFKEMMQ